MARTLIADLGGTNARFALAEEGRPGPMVALRVEDFPTPLGAIKAALAQLPPGLPVARLLCAVAAPVLPGPIRLTNAPWVLEAAALSQALGGALVEFLNDLEATAWALPALGPEDLRPLAEGRADPQAPRLVVAPGTGLGVAALVGQRALPTEGGHSAFAPGDAEEDAVLSWLRARQGPVSHEDLLCGSGLPLLHQALAGLAGREAALPDAAAVAEAARAGDALAVAAVGMFWRALGGFCGDAALMLGARGGVFLAGGVGQKLLDLLPMDAFVARFRDKPKMRAYLASIPLQVITHPQPALLGLARCAQTLG